MKNIAKEITLLEKKIVSVSNDLHKQTMIDLLKYINGSTGLFNNGDYIAYISALEQQYKDKLHELRKSQKQKSKQLDIEDEINLINNGTRN